MDHKNNILKGKSSGNILLITVLIGFCILAIIEIIYGQTRIRLERERLALQKENQQIGQELQAGRNDPSGNSDTGTGSATEVSPEQNDGSSENTPLNAEESSSSDSASGTDGEDDRTGPVSNETKRDMQIVFMGDSILDNDRENGGVAYLVSEACNANVYNMAIGGTTAALLPDEQFDFADWESIGLLGIVNAIMGNISPDFFEGYKAGEVLKECDFSQTDYFVIEYGTNDFLSRQIAQSKYLAGGGELDIDALHTYAGALDCGVRTLIEHFPNAKVVLLSPHYCQIFEGNTFMGDAYSVNYGYGSLVEFYRCSSYVAEQYKKDRLLFFNAFEQSGIDAYTADDYLEDGIHLSTKGRKLYAECVSRLILDDFYPEE